MHRHKGNLTGIDKRRALNPAIVGKKTPGNNGNKDGGLSSDEEVGLDQILVIND